LTCFDAYLAQIHGGSMMAFVQHQGGPHPSTGREKAILAEEERLAAERAQAAKDADDKLQRFLALKKMTLSQLAESQNLLVARK
jgi:hypothetical protein